MGLRETALAGIQHGFAALDNIKRPCRYIKRDLTSSYNPATGVDTPMETSYPIVGVLDVYSGREVDGQQVKPFDKKLIFEARILAVRPTLEDRVLLEDGSSWQVIGMTDDPITAHWELQLRGTRG